MNRPFNKKRFWLIIAILALVEALVCYVVLQKEYLFPSDEVSEVYSRYADDESIDASFIKGYRVNDTLFVDVTLLQAKDSAGWATLKTDFSIPDLPPDFQQIIDNGNELILTKKIPRQQDPLQQDTSGMIYDMAAIALQMHTVSIFHTKNLDERLAVVNHNFENNEKQFTK